MSIQSPEKLFVRNLFNNYSKDKHFQTTSIEKNLYKKVASTSTNCAGKIRAIQKKIPFNASNTEREISKKYFSTSMLTQPAHSEQPSSTENFPEQIKYLLSLHGYNDSNEILIQTWGNKAETPTITLKDLDTRYTELLEYFNKGCHVGFKRNGARKKEDLKVWRSLVIEFDGISLEEQLKRVKDVCEEDKIPFSSAIVYTGGKSYHFYWCFDELVSVKAASQLQQDLMALLPGCDTKFKSGVQVSRLPGFKHAETGKYAELTKLGTGKQYSFEELRALVPKQKITKPTNKTKEIKREADLALAHYEADTLTEDTLNKFLNTALSKINRAVEGNNANNAIYEAGLVIGSHILNGLDLEVATEKAKEAINRKGFSNYKKSVDTLQNGIQQGLINAKGKAKSKFEAYQLKPDEIINRRYIGNLDWLEHHPVVLIQSPINTGKTFAARECISKLPPTARILWITHSKALAHAVVNNKELGFISYDDSQVRSIVSLSAIGRLVITMDSLHHLTPKKEGKLSSYDLVIIDEIDQALDHLHTGGTSVKKFRRKCVTVLNTLLIHAKKVLGFSATLSELEVECVAALRNREDIWVVKNTHKEKQKKFVRFNDKEPILQELVKDIEAGKKVYIACNSKNEVKAIATRLKTKFPEKKIEEVHSENITQQEGLRDALTSKDADLGVDIVIASPSLGTGFDISRSYFDTVYGVFLKINALSATDLTQAIGRVRSPLSGTVKVFVQAGIQGAETNAGKNRSRLDVGEVNGEYLDPLTAQLILVNPEVVESHLNYASKSQARKALYTVDLCNSFWEIIRDNGHEVVSNETDEQVINGLKDGTIASEKEAIQEVKKEIKNEELTKLINTRIIDDLEKEELDIKKKSALGITEDEQSLLSRYYFDRNTGNKNPTLEYMSWYEGRSGKKVARMLQIEAMPWDYASAEDEYETGISGKLHKDRSHYVCTKFLIDDLKASLDESLEEFTINGQKTKGFTRETLEESGFISKLNEYSDLIKTYLEIFVSSTEPTKAAKSILESVFGIELESKQIRGKNNTKPRVYVPTEESKERVENLKNHIKEKVTQHWIQRCNNVQVYLYSSTRTNDRVLELYNLYFKIKAELLGEEYTPLAHKNEVSKVSPDTSFEFYFDSDFDSVSDTQKRDFESSYVIQT